MLVEHLPHTVTACALGYTWLQPLLQGYGAEHRHVSLPVRRRQRLQLCIDLQARACQRVIRECKKRCQEK